jgi:hypothetical protein
VIVRNLPNADEEELQGPGRSSLAVRVSMGTYKLFFQGEDCLVRRYSASELEGLQARARRQHDRRVQWTAGDVHGSG